MKVVGCAPFRGGVFVPQVNGNVSDTCCNLVWCFFVIVGAVVVDALVPDGVVEDGSGVCAFYEIVVVVGVVGLGVVGGGRGLACKGVVLGGVFE